MGGKKKTKNGREKNYQKLHNENIIRETKKIVNVITYLGGTTMKDLSVCIQISWLEKNFQYFSVFHNDGRICHAYNKPYLSQPRAKRRVFFSFLEPTHSSIKTTHIHSFVYVQTEMLPRQKRVAPKKSGLAIQCSAGFRGNASEKYAKWRAVLATVCITLIFFEMNQVGITCQELNYFWFND